MRRTALSVIIVAALLMGGCTDSITSAAPQAPPTTPPPTTPPAPVDMPDDPWHANVGTTTPTSAALTPPPDPNERARRRMDVDQLRRAFYTVTGGVGWTRLSGGEPVDQFEAYAETLGRPNFISSTLEDLSPGALFQKFLGDASREVCSEWLQREVESEVTDRTFFTVASPEVTPETDKSAIVANLAELKLRVHGEAVEQGDPALEQLTWLFESAYHIAKDPMTAWNTTCVALFTHPAFYTF